MMRPVLYIGLVILLGFNSCKKYDDLIAPAELPPLPLKETGVTVTSLPLGSDDRYGFYAKYTNAYVINKDDYRSGIPIISTGLVNDGALLTCRKTINELLSKRQDIRDAMTAKGAMMVIMHEDEDRADHPALTEGGDMAADVWETGVCYDGHKSYGGRDQTIERFARLIYQLGISDTALLNQIVAAKDSAIANGLFNPDSLLNDPNDPLPPDEVDDEYFAVGVAVWFGVWKTQSSVNNGEYTLTLRSQLAAQDPDLFAILQGLFVEEDFAPCN